jgi:hypothetical protein
MTKSILKNIINTVSIISQKKECLRPESISMMFSFGRTKYIVIKVYNNKGEARFYGVGGTTLRGDIRVRERQQMLLESLYLAHKKMGSPFSMTHNMIKSRFIHSVRFVVPFARCAHAATVENGNTGCENDSGGGSSDDSRGSDDDGAGDCPSHRHNSIVFLAAGLLARGYVALPFDALTLTILLCSIHYPGIACAFYALAVAGFFVAFLEVA